MLVVEYYRHVCARRHVLQHPVRQPFVVRREPPQLRRAHATVLGQLQFLFRAPAARGIEVRRLQEHEPIEAREQRLIASERIVHEAAPAPVRVFVSLQFIHRCTEIVSRLRLSAETPALDDYHVGGVGHRPHAAIDAVVENGVSGFVETSAARLVDRMRDLLADPVLARRLGEGARHAARERFDIRRFAAAWDRVIREVAGRRVTAAAAEPALRGGAA